ncbi:hypothetical protein EAG_14615 [Camponotus floridanus]|uniref:Uncharacterized protein n=1 Tax=Camponotus floridanus TaxID=104421 RepID=E1ZXQ9_CAMFO|nr:hypothetical protein EAG_14615 [Camponotus floridanus]
MAVKKSYKTSMKKQTHYCQVKIFLRYSLIVSFSKFHKSAAICLAQAFYYIGITAFNLIKLYPLTNSDTLDNFVNRFQPPTRSGQLAIAQEFGSRIFFALGQCRRQKKPLRNRTVGQYKRLMHGVKREERESNGRRDEKWVGSTEMRASSPTAHPFHPLPIRWQPRRLKTSIVSETLELSVIREPDEKDKMITGPIRLIAHLHK